MCRWLPGRAGDIPWDGAPRSMVCRASSPITSERGNTIAENTFVCDEGTSLVLMDGPNIVSGNRVVAREHCVPYEISTGGLATQRSELLDGLLLEGNTIDASRPPRLRYRNADVLIRD